ncbi:MAG: hypothetical protein ABJF01_23920 [bacterium]
MTRFSRASLCFAAGLSLMSAASLRGQDTTYRGIKLNGAYDPSHDRVSIVVLPVAGAFGDSVRAIIQRDLDFSDRFTVIPIDSADPNALRGDGPAAGLAYQVFARLNASAVVQITPVAAGLHVVLHDVASSAVVNVKDFTLPASGLNRDWRLSIHQISDEVERWVTQQRGIASTRIAYVRGQNIRIVDSDGASEITVPTEDCGVSPAWSPNGLTLAYATCGADSRIYIMDLPTGRSHSLIGPVRNTIFITPSFSPDGSSIVYSRQGEDQADLYLSRVAGGEAPRRLTTARGVLNTNAMFSPDGRRIVYVSSALGHPELYIIDADGTNANVLTDYETDDKNYRSDPDWSPDGRTVAYQERTNGNFQVRTIRVTGSTRKYLTSEGENEQPSWAPDARHIIFTSTRTGVRQLWILDSESGKMRQLTKSGGSRLAAWSPRIAAQP